SSLCLPLLSSPPTRRDPCSPLFPTRRSSDLRLLHQAAADRFPPERLEIEDQLMVEADRIIAECPQDADDQVTLYDADQRKISIRSEEHTSELQSREKLVCRLLLEKKKRRHQP